MNLIQKRAACEAAMIKLASVRLAINHILRTRAMQKQAEIPGMINAQSMGYGPKLPNNPLMNSVGGYNMNKPVNKPVTPPTPPTQSVPTTPPKQPSPAELKATAARRMNPQGQIPAFMMPGYAQNNPILRQWNSNFQEAQMRDQVQDIVSSGMKNNPALAPRTDDLKWGWEDEPAWATPASNSLANYQPRR